MNNKLAISLLVALFAAGCGDTGTKQQTQVAEAVKTAVSQNQQVNELVEQYFQESLAFQPIAATYIGESQYNDRWLPELTLENEEKELALAKAYLSKLEKIDLHQLSGQGFLTYQIFKRDLGLMLASQQFPTRYLPIDQMSGAHNTFAGLGSGESAQPFNTKQDYLNFIARAEGFVLWLNSVEANMREGIANKVVLPKILARKLVPQFNAHVVENAEDSLFWSAVKAMPASISADDKNEIESLYRKLISEQLVPAYRKMVVFLEQEYIPAARDTVGYSDLPNGSAWYEYYINEHTTLSLTADEIHEIGLSEVSRILNEMKKVKETVKFDGSLADFFVHLRESDEFYFDTPEELIAAYEKVKADIDSKVPALFNISPKADYIVKAVEAYRAESAPGASYESPAPDGSRPGIFYINTYNLKAQPKFLLETLSIHEASPGHHFQIALQQEVEGLPRYRKFGGYTVFAEGWALYAESLGKELGLFSDPYMWYGRLVDEQLRAMRLVVDTGLHAKGWTREQAIKYMSDNSSMAESDVVAEVERYIAWPGQALSYKLGEFKIRELREKAANALGDKFDIKAFHRQILIDGALPMPVLETKIERWINAQK